MKLFNYIFCVSGLYKLYAHSFQLSYCIFGNFLYIYMYLACTSTFMLESGLVLYIYMYLACTSTFMLESGLVLYIYMYLACTSTFMLESGLVLATNSPSKSQPVALCLCSYFAYFLIFFNFNPLQSGGLSHAY